MHKPSSLLKHSASPTLTHSYYSKPGVNCKPLIMAVILAVSLYH